MPYELITAVLRQMNTKIIIGLLLNVIPLFIT